MLPPLFTHSTQICLFFFAHTDTLLFAKTWSVVSRSVVSLSSLAVPRRAVLVLAWAFFGEPARAAHNLKQGRRCNQLLLPFMVTKPQEMAFLGVRGGYGKLVGPYLGAWSDSGY